MMRSLCCRFATALPILMLVSVLAHAQGMTQSQMYLLPSMDPGAPVGFTVSVQPGATVQQPSPVPGGTVTLYNGTTAVGSPATLSASSGFTKAGFAEVFGTPDATVAAAANKGAVWGDFNEDGAPDLLVFGSTIVNGQPVLTLQVFLGKSTGVQSLTFPAFTALPAQQVAMPPQWELPLTVLDVDGDGHLDLLAGNAVAYGKGDGTFGRVAVLPALASGFSETYAVDIDGDGKTDIVAVNTPPPNGTAGTVQYAFTVFHNNGGGSFTAMGPYPLAPSFTGGTFANSYYNIFGLSFADINGDGRIDVLSQSNTVPSGNCCEPAQLNVMLNLGTGFGAPKAIDTSGVLDEGGVLTSFTDLNGDGKLDLVFSYQANTFSNGVVTLLGNGDGTFAAPVNFTIGSTLTFGSPQLPVVTEDVNGDGKPDVVLGSGVLLLGNGDGTLTSGTPLFSNSVPYGTAPPEYALLTAPTLPGKGNAPFVALFFMNLQAGANAVFIPNLGSGVSLNPILPAGDYSLTAHYSGDATYAASVSNTVNVTIAPSTPAPTTMTLTSSANPIYASQSITFTATLSDPTITGSITFVDISKNDDNPLDPMAGTTESTLGTGTIANGVAALTAKLLVGGTHTILAVYGSDIYAPIAQAQLTETINVPFAVNVSDTGVSLTASPGQTATATLPVQGLGGFSGTVTFACRNFGGTCSFSPATVNVAGTGATAVTLTVMATAAPTTAEASPIFGNTILACSIPLFALFGIASVGRRRAYFAIIAIALCGITCLGCGGGGSGGGGQQPSSASLPAGNYPFYVTATSGQNELAINAVLTVQ